MLVLNVTCPLAPEEIRDFCVGKRAVLVVEEGQPEFIEQEILAILRRHRRRHAGPRQGPAGDGRRVHGGGDRARARRVRDPHAPGRRSRQRPGVAGGDRCAARRGRRGARAAAAGAPAELLRRLPGAAGVRGAQAPAAGHRARAHRGRHRLPLVRVVRAVLVGAHDPGLRDEPREPRRRVADDARAARSRSWATAASGTTGCSRACSRRCSTATTPCWSS